MTTYSESGEPEKTAISHLQEHLGKLETKLAEIKVLSSEDEYVNAQNELLEAFRQGDLEKIKDLLG